MGNESSQLIRDLQGGDPQAWDRFRQRAAKTVWAVCRLLTQDETSARDAFVLVEQALQADDFRKLRPYDGSSRLETFVALVTRDILSHRIPQLFRQDQDSQGWAAFERFYQADIERIIRRRLSGADQEDARRDAYQDICLALISSRYRRLKAFEGKGSFSGFVLHMVDRLLIDIIRKTNPRIRNPDAKAPHLRLVSTTELEDAPSPAPTPETAVLDEEADRLLRAAITVLQGALSGIPHDEQMYMRIALSADAPLPARAIARLMQVPVDEVYKLKRRVMWRLEKEISAHPDVKNWLASV